MSLNGLSGISTNPNNNNYNRPQALIENNLNLVDISSLYNYLADVLLLTLENNTSLSNISDLQLRSEMSSLRIVNCPIQEIPIFNTITYTGLLKLKSLPINNLNSFSNAENIQDLSISNLANINNLTGLSNISYVYQMGINSCSNFSNFDGIPLLGTDTGGSGEIDFSCKNNPNLSDFCGLNKWMNNNAIFVWSDDFSGQIFYTGYNVSGNAYNPTKNQIESTTECSQ